jgi:hypothetical protein
VIVQAAGFVSTWTPMSNSLTNSDEPARAIAARTRIRKIRSLHCVERIADPSVVVAENATRLRSYSTISTSVHLVIRTRSTPSNCLVDSMRTAIESTNRWATSWRSVFRICWLGEFRLASFSNRLLAVLAVYQRKGKVRAGGGVGV